MVDENDYFDEIILMTIDENNQCLQAFTNTTGIPRSPIVSMPAISTVATLIGVTITTARTVSVCLTGQVLPSYTFPRTPPVFTPAVGTLALT